MMGRTHALLGLNTLWIWEMAAVPLVTGADDTTRLTLCLLAAVGGALLPDLDAPVSLLQNFSVGGIRPLVLPARALHRYLGHRGGLHSLLALGAVGVLALPLLWVDVLAWWGLLLGYGSHLLGDAATKRGVPLLYPRRAAVHLLPCPFRLSTGSLSEEVVFAVLSASAMLLLLRYLFALMALLH
jgi:inner membrane protein